MKAFNTMMEIVVGLNLGPVSRLTAMWSALPEKYQELFESLMAFSSAVSGEISCYGGRYFLDSFFFSQGIIEITELLSKLLPPLVCPTWQLV